MTGHGYYGYASGAGPWHLLTSDRTATLCGVTRFRVTQHELADLTRLCPRCITAGRSARTPQAAHDPQEITRADVAAAEALAAITWAHEALAKALPVLHQAHSDRLNVHLHDAHTMAGYTLEALGQILGMTREAVRQRINRITEQAMSELQEQLGAQPTSSR